MTWTLRAFHHLLEGTEVILLLDGLGIHLLDRGDENKVGAYRLKLLAVGIDCARILGQVLLVVELYGVDKDADNGYVVLLLGLAYQR